MWCANGGTVVTMRQCDGEGKQCDGEVEWVVMVQPGTDGDGVVLIRALFLRWLQYGNVWW